MGDLNAFNGSLHVDHNACIGARSKNPDNRLKLEVTALEQAGGPVISPPAGIHILNSEDLLMLTCADSDDQTAQIGWIRGALCFGTTSDFDRSVFSEQVRIAESGNLGLGESDPQEKLQINGSVQGDQNGAL